jgi:hypothetical protein
MDSGTASQIIGYFLSEESGLAATVAQKTSKDSKQANINQILRAESLYRTLRLSPPPPAPTRLGIAFYMRKLPHIPPIRALLEVHINYEGAGGSAEAGHSLLSTSLKIVYQDETLFIQRSSLVLRAACTVRGLKQISATKSSWQFLKEN